MTSPLRRMPDPETLHDLFVRLVDQDYARQAGSLLQAFDVPRGSELAHRLALLNERALELVELGQRLTPDDPVVKAVRPALNAHLIRLQARMDPVAGRIIRNVARTGGALARRLTLGTTDASVLPGWNVPSVEAVRRVIDYTASPQWRGFLRDFPGREVERIMGGLARDFAQGVGPITSARHLQEAVPDMPRAAANNMLRTLQMTGLRDAQAVEYASNAAILEGQIRIATFDGRVCKACLALHGTRLPVGARVDGHHQCRCTSIGIIRGRARRVETGEAWLARQPAARQREILGGAYASWSRGQVRLREFVGVRQDPVFGRQIIEVAA